MIKSNFDQLCYDTLYAVNQFGIKSKTVISMFKKSCKMLKIYLNNNNLEFSLENGEKWLLEMRIFESAKKFATQCRTYNAHHRAVHLLADCMNNKLDSWRVYRMKSSTRPKTTEYLQLLKAYEDALNSKNMAKSTIQFAIRVSSDFLIYIENIDKFKVNDIKAQDVSQYFGQESFTGRKPEGVRAYAYKLKSFLRHLEDTDKLENKNLSLAVPKLFAKQESIITIMSEKAAGFLRSEDKPETKTLVRDHAMILLALRLGIRCSDIAKMKLVDIDWKNDGISFVQQKTKVPITLPLLPDVGNAIMNYILDYRPQAPDSAIFLRHYAPYTALTSKSNLVSKYLDDFSSEDCPEKSFHILRRTCASKMQSNSIPRSVISASLGHIDPNSSDVYISTDEKKMRRCAISLKGIECDRGEFQ